MNQTNTKIAQPSGITSISEQNPSDKKKSVTLYGVTVNGVDEVTLLRAIDKADKIVPKPDGVILNKELMTRILERVAEKIDKQNKENQDLSG